MSKDVNQHIQKDMAEGIYVLVSFPIPKEEFSLSISCYQEFSVRAKSGLTSITSNLMTTELFLLLHGKSIAGLKDANGIIERLCDKDQFGRMHDETRHRMHGRI